jgi:aldose 1-epimerase
VFKEYVLANNHLELTVIPQFGCHWTSLRVNVDDQWVDLLLPVPEHRTLSRKKWSGYGSYLLAPWSNRISGGAFRFANREHRLHVNSPDQTAIHGDVRTRPWKVLEGGVTSFEAELDSREFEDFNFPFHFHYRHSVKIAENRVTTGLWLKNMGQETAPAGMGFHPYFKRRLSPADPDVELTVPAEKVYPAKGCIPVSPAVPVTGKKDLRVRALLGKRNLDDCFTGLKPGPVKILYPGTGVEVDMRMDPVFSHVVVYAPDTWRGWGPSRPFFCIEPVTHANDAFNLLARGWEETGVKELEPGEVWGGTFDVTVARV